MKHLKLNAISMALAASLIAPVAMAENTVYGKGHVSIASIEDATGSAVAVTSHASRFGVKGSVKQDSSAEVIYKLEWQVDMADKADSTQIKARSQYIGLKDSWGEVRLGRDDSPYKGAGKKAVEFFSDTFADYNNIIDKGQDIRADNALSIKLNAGPGKVSLMYAAGDDTTAGDNLADMTSIAYDARFGAITLGLATQTVNKSLTNDETGTKLALGYKISDTTQLGFVYETVSDDTTAGFDDKNTLISFKHKMEEDAIKLAYGFKDQGLASDATMLAVAYDHKINKTTTAYALYADGSDNGLNDASKLAGDSSVIATGLVVKF
ncbi:MAG: porin [Gammaproteobacteria bacterium]|nr:porin [Gammaproteobacteria bacterium]